ncbi:MAG: hypothetical protein ABJA82_11985 [Myxococcales bacterium]
MPWHSSVAVRWRTAVGIGGCVASVAAATADPVWADHVGAKDGGAKPLPLQSATRIPAASTAVRPPKATGVIMGERWGCVSFDTGSGQGYQCWEAGPAPRARRVPWMDGKRFEVAPDHLCVLAAPELTFRCWHRPVPGEQVARPLPENWQWLNPHGVKWEDAYERADRVGDAEVGGTFSCLKTVKDSGLFCFGDDKFGQRGGSTGPPRPDAGPRDPAFVQDLWPAEFMAVGTWHACAFAAPRGMANGGTISCWGRGDGGQLGAPAPDQCRVDGRDVPCARKPIKGVAVAADETMLTLAAGDLFTCMTNQNGISCWGASRDAIFGVPGSCPASLRRAWPTLHGTVPAPRAACSAHPVRLPGTTRFNPNFRVFPRAVCFDQGGTETCLGGVPKSRDLRPDAISPGSDASACTLRDGRVSCWGEAYSPPRALDVPVAVTLEPTAPIGETAVIRFGDPAPWDDKSCLARRGCTTSVTPLPRCTRVAAGPDAGAVDVPTWSQLEPQAETLSGRAVRVRGPLGVGGMATTAMGCGTARGKRACCNRTSGPILLGGGAAGALALNGLSCYGDDSQACCNTPAYGQNVVAAGRLTPRPDEFPREPHWMLVEVKLCAE